MDHRHWAVHALYLDSWRLIITGDLQRLSNEVGRVPHEGGESNSHFTAAQEGAVRQPRTTYEVSEGWLSPRQLSSPSTSPCGGYRSRM